MSLRIRKKRGADVKSGSPEGVITGSPRGGLAEGGRPWGPKILGMLAGGEIGGAELWDYLRGDLYEELGIAKVDHARHRLQGVPEVILAKGKLAEDVVKVAHAMHRRSGRFLITKASRPIYEKLDMEGASFHERSGVIKAGEGKRKKGRVVVISAGTSDIPVAEEAALTASFLGSRVETLYDVGVAGLHRLLGNMKILGKARCMVVVAGMEGALPSVVGGLTDKPVIAVPASTGYGASLGGLAALLAMLNSCVPGIAVMNIDNGFGAGCLAHKINTLH
ncbi:MAG: nickel pincer cofactor biosynthesis protein LarB [Nitrospiraceae bacterium]|nr:nickel pincer cofactor biosynthesis protein LarB [Nitrospiraceae bacterium]